MAARSFPPDTRTRAPEREPDEVQLEETQVAPPVADLDDGISFPELVWAHYLKQKELFDCQGLTAPSEQEYRRRLKLFKQEHGEIVNAYWCRYEASGAAVTDRTRRYRWRPWRTEPILRFHAATDWRTHDVPEVAELLHTCEALAIRVGEVLRGTSERIALQWILAISGRLLGAIDQAKEEPLPNTAKLGTVVKTQRAELRQVERYYDRAGQKAARLVYFQGMMRGVLALIALSGLVLLVLWPFDGIHPHQERTQALFAAYAMGAVGAVVSVMSRMATAGRFRLDHEVGRKVLRRLGSFRPFIGAIFALVLYFALKSSLLEIGNLKPADKTIYFYATIGFLAGFSERWAKVLLDNATGGSEGAASSVTKTAEAHDET
jgi:hypothetical protein